MISPTVDRRLELPNPPGGGGGGVVVAKGSEQGLHKFYPRKEKEVQCAKSMSHFLYGCVNVGTLNISSTVYGKEIM